MTTPVIHVLLVEDNAGDARLIHELLRDGTADPQFEIHCADRLASALEYVRRQRVDVILLDLALPDSRGAETFMRMLGGAPGIPILVLTGHADESLGSLTVREGAQDYLVKGQSDARLLTRAIRYAIERKRTEAEIRGLNETQQHALSRTSELAAANDELIRARRELQDFIDAMSTLNAKVAPDGTLLLVNRIGQRASGMPLDVLMKTNFLDGKWWAFDREVQERVRAAFHRATEGALISYEERLFAFGRILTIHLTLAPVKGPDGNVEYIVAEGRDISRRVEVEEALKATNQELEAFTYSVSHDLRAPIRQIDGFSRLLAEELGPALNDKARHYFTRIRESTQNMGRLVDDLLRLAKLGRQSMHPRPSALDALVQEVVAEAQADTVGRNICWKIGALPVVECDPGLLRVVFSNLIGNAVKYTRPRSPAVIEIGVAPRPGRTVIFVRDNGVGFDMKYADRLFGVFQRLHRADEFEGTGVGLATVQRIVHKHGGEIWAEAAPDRGATFYFTLGLASAVPAAAP